MRHLHSAFICTTVHQNRFTIISGDLSSTTTSVQYPLGWCDSSHSTKSKHYTFSHTVYFFCL